MRSTTTRRASRLRRLEIVDCDTASGRLETPAQHRSVVPIRCKDRDGNAVFQSAGLFWERLGGPLADNFRALSRSGNACRRPVARSHCAKRLPWRAGKFAGIGMTAIKPSSLAATHYRPICLPHRGCSRRHNWCVCGRRAGRRGRRISVRAHDTGHSSWSMPMKLCGRIGRTHGVDGNLQTAIRAVF